MVPSGSTPASSPGGWIVAGRALKSVDDGARRLAARRRGRPGAGMVCRRLGQCTCIVPTKPRANVLDCRPPAASSGRARCGWRTTVCGRRAVEPYSDRRKIPYLSRVFRRDRFPGTRRDVPETAQLTIVPPRLTAHESRPVVGVSAGAVQRRDGDRPAAARAPAGAGRRAGRRLPGAGAAMPGWASARRAGWPAIARTAPRCGRACADASPDAPAPVALGALPFRLGEMPDALWRGLMPGGLMLPERLYLQQGGRAWLRLTLPAREAGALSRPAGPCRRGAGGAAAGRDRAAAALTELDEGEAPQRYAQRGNGGGHAHPRRRAGQGGAGAARQGGVRGRAGPGRGADAAVRPPSRLRALCLALRRQGVARRHPEIAGAPGRPPAPHRGAGRHPHARARRRAAGLGQGAAEHDIVVEAVRRAIAPLVARLARRRPSR